MTFWNHGDSRHAAQVLYLDSAQTTSRIMFLSCAPSQKGHQRIFNIQNNYGLVFALVTQTKPFACNSKPYSYCLEGNNCRTWTNKYWTTKSTLQTAWVSAVIHCWNRIHCSHTKLSVEPDKIPTDSGKVAEQIKNALMQLLFTQHKSRHISSNKGIAASIRMKWLHASLRIT